jgi:hypothetical protein
MTHPPPGIGCRMMHPAPDTGCPIFAQSHRAKVGIRAKARTIFLLPRPNFADLQKGAPTTPSIAACQFSAVMVMHSEQDAGCRVIRSAPILGAPSSRSLIALRWAFARKREPSFSSLDPNFADLQKGAPTTSSIAACQFSAVILSAAKDPRICFLQLPLPLLLFVLSRHPRAQRRIPAFAVAVAVVRSPSSS